MKKYFVLFLFFTLISSIHESYKKKTSKITSEFLALYIIS